MIAIPDITSSHSSFVRELKELWELGSHLR